jgi:LysM repeat protein
LAISRRLTHVFVLLLVLAISGYASFDRHLPAGLSLRLGLVNAQGLVNGQGGSSGSVTLGRSGTIVKPASVPTNAVLSHNPAGYQVQPGEKLQDIANRYGISVDDLRWSNFAALQNLSTDVSAGQSIVVPPTPGIVVAVKAGDTAQSLASAYHVNAQAILDFNYIRTDANAALTAGGMVVVPGGTGPDFVKPVARRMATPSLPVSSNWTPAMGNRFAFGFCTWYVYNRKPVPWLGNANQWFAQAQAFGWRTGQTPAVGAIMVTYESGFGHVAYVESVNSDGSWRVSEMNFNAWDVVDFRTIKRGSIPLAGFIYGP